MKRTAIPTKDIPVAILCGGLGTRLKEETERLPKPLIPIGERPLLWHIMKIYHAQGYRRFILLLGYKGEQIKEYFYHYALFSNDFTIVRKGADVRIQAIERPDEDWEITFLDTGQDTQTGGRVRQLTRVLAGAPDFMLTYGDGVANVDLGALLSAHRRNGCLVTLTAVSPPGRFGELMLDEGRVTAFNEKPAHPKNAINGGFFAVRSALLPTLGKEPGLNFEADVLPDIARKGKLGAVRHEGFWQCMDTLRDVEYLNGIWKGGSPPWKIW